MVTENMGNPCDSQGGDSDNDGICANVDCNDNDAAIGTAQTPGTSCDDGNPNTDNDVIQADGCTCQGEMMTGGGTADCNAVEFIGGAGTITLTNLTAPSEKIEIIGAPTNYELITICEGNCGNPQVISNLAAGTYTVKLIMEAAIGCYREETVVVGTSMGQSSSNRTASEVQVSGFSQRQNITLQWIHFDERAKNYFVVEKSTDGQLFEPILIKKSEDVGNNLEAYTELDENPIDGANYYRIGSAFSDGDFNYSKVIKVNFHELTHFSIFPNPVNFGTTLFVNLKDFEGLSADLSIYNSLGQSVQSLTIDKINASPIGIPLKDFEGGIYTVGVEVDGKTLEARRFIIQRL